MAGDSSNELLHDLLCGVDVCSTILAAGSHPHGLCHAVWSFVLRVLVCGNRGVASRHCEVWPAVGDCVFGERHHGHQCSLDGYVWRLGRVASVRKRSLYGFSHPLWWPLVGFLNFLLGF